MFRSLSWASINKPANSEQMNHFEGPLTTEGKKQKKYKLKKKKDGKLNSGDTLGSSDTTSSEEFLHQIGKNLTSTPKSSNSVYAKGHDKPSKGITRSSGFVYVNGRSREEKTQSGNFALSGMPQNSSLTSFYSCDNIPKAAPQSSDSESEMSSTEIIEERSPRQPPKYSEHISSHTQEQREAEDTLSDLQVVLRTRSLGDLTANQGLSLAPPQPGLRETWQEAEVQTRYIHSAGSSRTVVVNPPTLKREVPRQRPNRQNRRSCVARIEDKENRDYLEDFYGRSLQKTPRQRRSLPQIPNNDIDEKKRRFTELMMRRLTVCNGEIATYLQESGNMTGSLNEIRDGRYISRTHIHLTPSDSINSQLDLPEEEEFEPPNRFQGSPVQIISSPRSPETLISGSYSQQNARRRTPDPFTDSPKMARMPLIEERETAHTPLSRIAKSDAHQYQTPRSRAALIDAPSDQDFHNEKLLGYHGNNPAGYQGNNCQGYPGNGNSSYYKGRSGQSYAGSHGSGYYGNSTENVNLRPREALQRGNRAHSYHGNLSSSNYGNNPYGTLPRGVNSGSYIQDNLAQFSTLPRPEKTDYTNNCQRVPTVISPGKSLSESGSDQGQANVASRGSMVDSGYGTNGESDYGVVPGRPVQPQKIYAKERNGILKQRSNEFNKSSDGSFERNSLESPPDPVTTNPAPSLHQLMSMCNIHPVRLSLPPIKMAADLIHIHEESINLPTPRYKDSEKAVDSPKGRRAVGLGGPGSAFRRVSTNMRNIKCYNLVSVENVNKNCQPKQGDACVEKGDFLLEINGQGTLGLDFSAVLSILESIQGVQLEVVVARKKPQERGQETLSSEISKLRQQCAYLITEVKSKEQIITDLSTVEHTEVSPRQSQSLTLDPPMTRQEAYYTCELSEDEFIV